MILQLHNQKRRFGGWGPQLKGPCRIICSVHQSSSSNGEKCGPHPQGRGFLPGRGRECGAAGRVTSARGPGGEADVHWGEAGAGAPHDSLRAAICGVCRRAGCHDRQIRGSRARRREWAREVRMEPMQLQVQSMAHAARDVWEASARSRLAEADNDVGRGLFLFT